MFTRIAVLFLCICILLTVMSAAVFASGEEAAPVTEQAVPKTEAPAEPAENIKADGTGFGKPGSGYTP